MGFSQRTKYYVKKKVKSSPRQCVFLKVAMKANDGQCVNVVFLSQST